MPITVTCTGCGNKLKVKDEFLGKRIKCPQCNEKFVATEDLAEDDESPGQDSAQKTADWITAQLPAVGGLVLMIVGFVIIFGTGFTRFGLAIVGLGICSIGYWALSSSNKDYNF